jgi:hypothetical protein
MEQTHNLSQRWQMPPKWLSEYRKHHRPATQPEIHGANIPALIERAERLLTFWMERATNPNPTPAMKRERNEAKSNLDTLVIALSRLRIAGEQVDIGNADLATAVAVVQRRIEEHDD